MSNTLGQTIRVVLKISKTTLNYHWGYSEIGNWQSRLFPAYKLINEGVRLKTEGSTFNSRLLIV